ncbi:MAG: hypothetical protein E7571_04070 [Ruminococcaceae bacterium]|nr:hypothetical protein [Oscillospiraceae bacterium]
MKLHFKKALAALISAVMIITSLMIPSAAFAKTAENKYYVEGEIIVVLKDNADKKYLKASATKTAYGSSFKQKNAFTFGTAKNGVNAVVLKSGTLTTKQMLAQVKKNNAVKYALPNYKVKASSITDDTYSEYQWALDNTGQNFSTAGNDTNADALWKDAEKSEEEQVVAIVDTGIDWNHPDLKDVVWNNPYGKKLLGKHGMDFTGTINNGEPYDDNGHGSHCAGIIAAQANNGEGISGINASNVKIMGLKFLDSDGGGTTEGALAAYEYLQRAVKLGTNVVACNNSWGGMGGSEEKMLLDSIYDQLGEMGVITFVAAGNESTDIGETGSGFFFDEEYYTVPACCESEYCITVAASNENDELADFSNYSDKLVDIAAPGADILSSVSYNCFNPTLYTAEQKQELCAYNQDYNGTVSEGDFGYPVNVKLDDEDYNNITDYEITQVDGFGLDGKALKITFNDEIPEDDAKVFAFEIPFTVADKDKDYSISVMGKGNNYYECPIYDVPASTSATEVLRKYEYNGILWGTKVDNYWDHSFADIDTDSEDVEYKKDTDRKLVFVVTVYEPNTTITIDDLAISSQTASADDFGKYDFYNGTSMATPYATGAAALIKNAHPDASTLDIINMIKNSGRYSASLEGKTQNAKVLDLSDVEKIPPMITDVNYDENGDIAIKGSFRNITSVTVNDEDAEIISTENNLITVKDNNYCTKKIEVKVTNGEGSDAYQTFVSNKPSFGQFKIESVPDAYGTIAVPGGSNAYFVTPTGSVGAAKYSEWDKTYEYSELGMIDTTEFFESGNYTVTSAVYCGKAIYMTVLEDIMSEYSGTTIGYETAFVRYDINTGATTKLAEIPDESFNGSSLAVYNGTIYLIGGYDIYDTHTCSNAIYKYDASTSSFTKIETTLPEGRASARFIQYKDKLVGMFGMNDEGTFPSILVFDGKNWKTSETKLESDDSVITLQLTDGKIINLYQGNLGYGYNGILVNGPYMYGIGDTFIYNPDSDSININKRSFRNSLEEPKIVGTTVPGRFIGFPEQSIMDIDEDVSVGALARIMGDSIEDISFGDDDDYPDDEEMSGVGYVLVTNNNYATLDMGYIEHGYVSSVDDYYFNYGDKVEVKVATDPGYVVTNIKAGDKVIAKNTNTVYYVVKEENIEISATTKLVVSPVTTLKASKVANGTTTLTWNKVKKGEGYQVQQYVGGKWKTVKTIKNTDTVSCKLTVKKGTSTFRVRAYGKFSTKTVYGGGKAVKVKY